MSTEKSEKTAKPDGEKYPRKAVPIYADESKEEGRRNYATMLTSSVFAAYRVINGVEQKSGLGEAIDVPTLLEQLIDQAHAVNRGDLAQAEAMLINQATALQSLFARLAERGMTCEQAPAFEANMRMALRAQAQCRATLETLANIKNPPVIYAKQANISNGPQQVNNGDQNMRAKDFMNNTHAHASASEKKEIEPSKLSGENHELRPDTRASSFAGRVNQAVEALGEIDRAEIGRR